jgi:hypothetical protein
MATLPTSWGQPTNAGCRSTTTLIPMTDGPTYGPDEVDPDPDAEYETIRSALDMGFEAFGSGSSDVLSDFTYAPTAK